LSGGVPVGTPLDIAYPIVTAVQGVSHQQKVSDTGRGYLQGLGGNILRRVLSMPDISIDVLTQLSRVFKEIKALALEGAVNKAEKRNNFFINEIEPIHNTINAIYKDYMNSFVEISEIINNMMYDQKLKQNIRNEVMKRRLKELMARKQVYALSFEFQEIIDKPYYHAIKSKPNLQKNEIKLFKDYCESIRDFLFCFDHNHYDERNFSYFLFIDDSIRNDIKDYEKSINHHDMSGYSHLLQLFDDYILDKELTVEGYYIVNDVISAYCENACQIILPYAYGRYYTCYTRLRLHMCYPQAGKCGGIE
jgi:hypothetical protein